MKNEPDFNSDLLDLIEKHQFSLTPPLCVFILARTAASICKTCGPSEENGRELIEMGVKEGFKDEN